MTNRLATLLILACTVSSAQAADDLFIASDIGLLYRVRNLQRGNFSVGMPGGALVSETNVSGGMFGLTSLATTATPLSGGGQVVVGTNNGLVIPYDVGLAGQTDDPWDVSGDVDDPIQALAVGSMGSMPVAVAAAHSLRNVPDAGVGSTFLVGDSNLDFVKNGSMTALSDPDVTGLRFAELNSSLAGNELLVTTTNLTTLAKDSGFVGSFTLSDTDASNPATALDHAWDNDGDISSIQNPWQFPNNTIAGVVVGDYFTTNSVDEFTILGSTNNGTPSGSGFGKGIQSYQPEPFGFPQFPGFLWENGLGFPDQTVDPVVTGGSGELLDGEIDGQFWPGPEVVVAGNQQIRIINSNLVSGRPAIDTNQDITSLVLADVLGDDGIPEIVVGTSNTSPSTNALLLVYERDPNDPTSDFTLDAENFTRGAIFDFGNDKSIVDLASLLVTTTMLDGDYDDDGIVGAGDLGLVLQAWGTNNYGDDWINQVPPGTNVGANELSVVLQEWGNMASPLAVPEPSAAIFLCAGVTLLVTIRRSA